MPYTGITPDAQLLEQWKSEEDAFRLRGWDFSCIAGRWDCPEPPWDYVLAVKSYLRDTHLLLDMGTGGGEVLLTIGHPHKNTTVTEGYVPNFELCKRELSPLGIMVAQTFGDKKLPFADQSFDFIINKHESFDIVEVSRILKPSGYFFTQQVGHQNVHALELAVNGKAGSVSPERNIDRYANALKQRGFQIIMRDEAKFPVRFFDVAAVIFFCKACVWNFPGFSVETHFDQLRNIQKKIDANGFFQATGHRFLLAARLGNQNQEELT